MINALPQAIVQLPRNLVSHTWSDLTVLLKPLVPSARKVRSMRYVVRFKLVINLNQEDERCQMCGAISGVVKCRNWLHRPRFSTPLYACPGCYKCKSSLLCICSERFLQDHMQGHFVQIQCPKVSEAFLIRCVTRLVVFRRNRCMPGLAGSDTGVMFAAVSIWNAKDYAIPHQLC